MMTALNPQSLRFLTEVVKPWERLNQELGKSFSLSPEVNDLTSKANSLAVSLAHFLEFEIGTPAKSLFNAPVSFRAIVDLADSYKHRVLRKPERMCQLSVSSMFERNHDAMVRFLRCRLNLAHPKYGKLDFMKTSMEAAEYVGDSLSPKLLWQSQILEQDGPFSHEIKLHASNRNQVAWSGMVMEFVQRNSAGDFENVDLQGTVKFTLTSDF
ncbi:MAG: hypothetical protein ACO1NQ_05030 [Flavobacteriales bacterium]